MINEPVFSSEVTFGKMTRTNLGDHQHLVSTYLQIQNPVHISAENRMTNKSINMLTEGKILISFIFIKNFSTRRFISIRTFLFRNLDNIFDTCCQNHRRNNYNNDANRVSRWQSKTVPCMEGSAFTIFS